jgi:hypothetical protein
MEQQTLKNSLTTAKVLEIRKKYDTPFRYYINRSSIKKTGDERKSLGVMQVQQFTQLELKKSINTPTREPITEQHNISATLQPTF